MKKLKNQAIPSTFSFSSPTLLATLACAAVLILLFYLRFFVNFQMFYSADHYPGFFIGQKFWFETFEKFKTFPWWDPYVDFGTSFLYNPNRGVFYPLNYLQFLVSPLFYYRWNWVGHLLIFAAAIFSWGKTKQVSPLLLFTLTLLIVTSPFINVFSVTNIVYLHAVAWTAWIFAELEKRHTGQFSLGRFLIFWALLISVGEPFSAFLSGVSTLVYFSLEKRKKWLLSFLILCLVVGILVFGHAFLILPYTTRRGGVGESVALSFSLHPYRLITLFSPLFYGHPFLHNFDPDSVTNDSPYSPRFFFDTLYFPLPVILLAFLGLRECFRKKQGLTLGLLLFGLSLSFGRWGLMKYVSKIPPFSFLRYPEKMIWTTAILFLGFGLKNFSENSEHALKKDKGILFLLGLACVLPFLAKTPEYGIGIASLVLAAAIFLLPATQDLILAFLVVGLIQNYLAFPDQRVAPAETENQLTKTAADILTKIPEGSLDRIEVTPHFFEDGYPHGNLLWGSNMVYRRASLFSYESINTPLNEQMKVLLYGDNYQDSSITREKPRDPERVEEAIRLTNLHLIAVKEDKPMMSLVPSVESKNAIFQAQKGDGKTVFLIPKSLPSPVWYFPKLETWKKSDSPLKWPPSVDRENPFVSGVKKKGFETAPKECESPLSPEPLKEDSVYLLNENHFLLDVDLPCEGWIFLSQNLFPGWRAHDSNGNELPLYSLNETLTGLNLSKGKHHIELTFHPWWALMKTFIPF